MTGKFEIDDPSIDLEALEERIREAIEAKRGVRFTDEELQKLRAAKVQPRPRRADLPRGWLEQMPEVRSKLPKISPPPGVDESPTVSLYVTGSAGFRGRVLGFLRRVMRPFYRSTLNLEPVLSSMIEATNEQGAWLSELTGQLDRWHERDLHLLHNLVYELTSLNLELGRVKDRINEVTRRLDMLAERERALERLALDDGRVKDAASGDSTSGGHLDF
jgi:hypothetical protein